MTRYYSANAQDTTVTSAITSSSTSVVVGATTNFPTQYPFILALDFGGASEELVAVTSASGLTLTITRGFNGTTAQAHSTGAVVRHVATAQDFTDAQNHYAATTSVHGITDTSTLLTAGSTSTLTNKDLTSGTNTFPTSLATLTGTQTLTNKDLTSTTNTFGALVLNSIAFNAQTGTTYTLVGTDIYKLVTLNNASAVTLTIPSGVFTTGQAINIQQIGAGQVTVQGDGTSTFTGTGTKLRAQYSAASIVCTGTNTFTLIGDIA
jgi:hypothetical protein